MLKFIKNRSKPEEFHMQPNLSLKKIVFHGFMALSILTSTSCATGGGSVAGNGLGSSPVNDSEIPEYQKAVSRCHKTGGTRVIKIDGRLRCF